MGKNSVRKLRTRQKNFLNYEMVSVWRMVNLGPHLTDYHYKQQTRLYYLLLYRLIQEMDFPFSEFEWKVDKKMVFFYKQNAKTLSNATAATKARINILRHS